MKTLASPSLINPLVKYIKIASILVFCTYIAGCLTEENAQQTSMPEQPTLIPDQPEPESFSEKVTLLKPERSPIAIAAQAASAVEQNNTIEPEVLFQLAGYWEGNITFLGTASNVSAAITLDGAITITSTSDSMPTLMISDALLQDGKVFATLNLQAPQDEAQWSVEFILSPTLIEAVVLPFGELANLTESTLLLEASNSIGSINLTKTTLNNPLRVKDLVDLQLIPESQSDYASFAVDENGNFAAALGDCVLTGGFYQTANMPGLLNFVTSQSDEDNCSQIPNSSPENPGNGHLLFNNQGQLVIAYQGSDGERVSYSLSIEDILSGRLTQQEGQ